MAQVSKGMIRWDGDDWLQGLVPQWSSSSSLYRKTVGVKGLSYMRGIDVHRQPGYLMPGSYGTDMTTVSVVDGILRDASVNSSVAYPIGGAKLHKLDLTNDTFTNAGAWPHTITPHGHSGASGQGTAIYYVGAVKYLFYSWNDATDGDVGRYDLSATFDDDYMSTVAASGAALTLAVPHPMVVGTDDLLYIANGNKLAGFDGQTGANGTFYAAKLTLPKDYVITSFAKLGDALVIYAYKGAGDAGSSSYYRSETTAFFWDYLSEDPYKSEPLQGNYVNGGFSYQGTVGCFVQGRSAYTYSNKYSSLLLFDGSKFQTVATFTDNIPYHGGVEVADEVIYWNSAGVIYQYGSPHPGFKKVLGRLTEVIGGTTTGGLLRNFGGAALYASAGTSTDGGLQKLNENYYFQSLFATPIVSPGFSRDYQGKVERVKIYWGSAASLGYSFTLQLNTGRGTLTSVVSNLATVTDLVTTYDSAASNASFPFFETIGLQGNWSSASGVNTAVPPYPEAIEVYFTESKI